MILGLAQFLIGSIAGYLFCNFLHSHKLLSVLKIIKKENEKTKLTMLSMKDSKDEKALRKIHDEVLINGGMLKCLAELTNYKLHE